MTWLFICLSCGLMFKKVQRICNLKKTTSLVFYGMILKFIIFKDPHLPIVQLFPLLKNHTIKNKGCEFLATYTYNFMVGAMLTQTINIKCDKPIAYASHLSSMTQKNYTTMELEALDMVYALHQFIHYPLGNK